MIPETKNRHLPFISQRSQVYTFWPPEIWPRLLIFTCLIVATLIFMVQVRRHYEFPKSFSFRLFTLLAVLTWWAALSRVRRFANPYAPAFALWILGMGLSITAGVNMAESLDVLSIIDTLTCFFFLYIVINSLQKVRHLKQALFVMALAAILVSIYGTLQYFNLDPWKLVTNRVPVSSLGNQNYATYVHDIVMPFSFTFFIYLVLSLISHLQLKDPLTGISRSPHDTAGPLAFTVLLLYLGIGYFHMANCNTNGNWVATRLAAYGMTTAILLFWTPPREWKKIAFPIQMGIVLAAGVTVAMYTGSIEGWGDGVMLGIALAVMTGAILFWSMPRFFRVREDATENQDRIVRQRNVLRRIGLIVSIIIFLSGCVIFAQTSRYQAMWNKNSNKFRRDIWLETLQKIKTNVILGIGPHNFKVVHPLYESMRERIVLGKEVLGRTAHNDYLEKISESGIIGALGIFWLQVIVVMLLWTNLANLQKLRDRLDAGRAPPLLLPKLERFYLFGFWFAIGQLGAIIALGFHAHVEESFRQPASVILFTFTLGTVAVLRRMILRALAAPDVPTQSSWGVQPTFLGRIWPDWNRPELRWALVPIVALLLYTPTMKQFLSEALVRAGMNEHDLAEYYRQTNQEALAEKVDSNTFTLFEKANKLYPWYMEDYYILGRYCIDSGRYQQGVELLLKDIWMNPNYKWAHNNIGVCYDRLEDTPNARLHYYAALEIDPRQIYALYNLGVGYLRTGDYWPAIVKFTESLSVEPTKLDACRFRAIAWSSLAEQEMDPTQRKRFLNWARQDLEKYLGSAPPSRMDLPIYMQIANEYIESGSYAQALPLLEKARQVNPNDVQVLQSLAILYQITRQNAELLSVLEKLTTINPKDADTWYNLAKILALDPSIPFNRVFSALREAFLIDPRKANDAVEEPVFQPLQTNADFQELIRAFRQ